MKTLYDLLGIGADADAETIKKAFRKAVKRHHPDHHPGDPHAAFWFRQIIAANQILRDEEQRADYDRMLAFERQRIRSEWTRILIFEAICIPVLSLVLVIASVGLEQIFSTSVVADKVERHTTWNPTDVVAEQPTAQTDATGPHESGDKPEAPPERRMVEPSTAVPATNDTAVQDITSAPGLQPTLNDAKFYRQRGIAAYRGGDFRQAIADLDQAIRLDPKDAKAYNIRGNAWDYLGDSDRALADYDEAIDLDPNNPAVFHDRGMMWRRKGDLDKALVDMDRAIRFGFSDASLYGDRGRIWYEKGRYYRAIADFDRASKINPDFADASTNHGIDLHRESDFADVDRAIRIDPNMPDFMRGRDLRP
jgi:tetratricopeptide (TPR) repeat protein